MNSPNIKKRLQHMTLEIQILSWDRHKNVTVLNRLKGSQHYPLDKWISNVCTSQVKTTITHSSTHLLHQWYKPGMHSLHLNRSNPNRGNIVQFGFNLFCSSLEHTILLFSVRRYVKNITSYRPSKIP